MLIVCEVYHGRSAKQQLVTVGRQTEWAGTKSKLKVNLSRLVWKSKTKVRNHASLVETGTEAPPLVRSSNHYRSFNEGFVLRSASNGPRTCAWLLCSRPALGTRRRAALDAAVGPAQLLAELCSIASLPATVQANFAVAYEV
jgi:hypothetical protein